MKKLYPFCCAPVLFSVFFVNTVFAQTTSSPYLADNANPRIEKSTVYVINMVHLDKEFYAYEERFVTGGLHCKGKIKSEKKRKKLGYWTTYFENGTVDQEGEYVKNQKQGTWKWYFESGQLAAVEEYKAGKRIAATFYDQQGKEVKQEEAEVSPMPAEGMEHFRRYISQQAQQPLLIPAKDKEAKFFMQFMVDKHGNLYNIKCQNSETDSKLSQEMVRLISLSPAWIPGKEHNRAANLQVVLPVAIAPKR